MGNTAIVQVDNLQYEYFAYSNKLKKVTDNTGNPGNGTAGDFKDGSNGLSDDYVYDANGNLITDLNKDIKNLVGTNGIRYNHLDKPEEIKIEGKGTIKITYDATGAKLKREFISSTGGGTKVTWYMGAYQYEEVVGGSNPQAISLSFISFSEGRIRPITAENSSNTHDAFFKNALLTLPGSKKMMLGLLVFQGLRTEEIKRIQRKDLQLSEGKVFIRGTKRTNERWLSLQAVQIPAIQSHLQGLKFKDGQLLQQENNGQKSEQNVVNQIAWMFRQLKELNPSVTNAKQIRGSVITEWLRKYPLREVQYMAGHKYVSSTERYQVSGLEDLQQAISEHHPRK